MEENIYVKLNKIIEYIENNLENDIDFSILSKMIGVNEYTFQKLFSVLCNITITEYIRNRRLSNAGQELYLYNENIIDIAFKYQYTNPASFSRAFEKFHGIKPSEVKKKNNNLRIFAKIHFNEENKHIINIDYEIIEMDEMVLYGKNIKTDTKNICNDAPKLYENLKNEFEKVEFGLTEYSDKERMNVSKYWILTKKYNNNFEKIVIPKSKWIRIRIKSQEADEIQKTVKRFYESFLPSSKLILRDLPELEHYHDGLTDFLIPIEK